MWSSFAICQPLCQMIYVNLSSSGHTYMCNSIFTPTRQHQPFNSLLSAPGSEPPPLSDSTDPPIWNLPWLTAGYPLLPTVQLSPEVWSRTDKGYLLRCHQLAVKSFSRIIHGRNMIWNVPKWLGSQFPASTPHPAFGYMIASLGLWHNLGRN